MSVVQLGTLGFEVRDLAAWRNLAVDVLGMEARPRAKDSEAPLYLRMDDRAYRLALFPAKREGVRWVGWETADEEGYEATVRRIVKWGVKLSRAKAAECRERRVTGLVRFVTPGGISCSLSFGPVFDEKPFRPGRAMSGFVTGDLGLGHVLFACADPAKEVEFYREALGFKLSETMEFAGVLCTFLHCNPRGHSIAICNPGLGTEAGQINHFMIQVKTMDDVGHAYDLCMANDVPIVISIGKHTNDKMTSFYLATPSGFAIEYGQGGIEIDDSKWKIQHYMAPSIWGHNLVSGNAVTLRNY